MPITTRNLLDQYTEILQKIYGKHLKKVILYGSYARGDYNDQSDIDIMLLVDLTAAEMDAYADQLSDLGFEYNVDYDIWMMPVVKNKQHFEKWAEAYPFYAHVQREGVILYEAA